MMQMPHPIHHLRHWLEQVDIDNPALAVLICRVIPGRCPFERSLHFWQYRIQIPPLCKFNPFYQQFLSLRCKALHYLYDSISDE